VRLICRSRISAFAIPDPSHNRWLTGCGMRLIDVLAMIGPRRVCSAQPPGLFSFSAADANTSRHNNFLNISGATRV
jgi:hypothetical protein